MPEHRRQPLVQILVFAFCAFALIAAIGAAFLLARDMQTQTRGVTYANTNSIPLQTTGPAFGVNVALEQYSDDQLTTVLALIRNAHLTRIRQHFYWNAIEPRKGEFQWDKWDRILARVNDLPNKETEFVAVL
ncbi:MAG TPA: beta-galactosidase, partial [Anaerolineae bacterium]